MNKELEKDKIINDLQLRLEKLERSSSVNQNNRSANLTPHLPAYSEIDYGFQQPGIPPHNEYSQNPAYNVESAVGYRFERPISGRGQLNRASDQYSNNPANYEGAGGYRFERPVRGRGQSNRAYDEYSHNPANYEGAVGYRFERPVSGRGRSNRAYEPYSHNPPFINNFRCPPPQRFQPYPRFDQPSYSNHVQNVSSDQRNNSAHQNARQWNDEAQHEYNKELKEKHEKEQRLREEKIKQERIMSELEKVKAENRKIERAEVETATVTQSMEETLTNEKIKGEKLRKRQKEIAQVLRAIKEASKLDICFLIDCTSSMKKYIKEVKNKIIWLKNQIITMHASVDTINFAFVGYRDICNGSENFSILPFTQSLTEFENFVKSVKAQSFGGCSQTADVLGGLNEVSNLRWTAPMTKILIHVCDVSGHGRRFHYRSGLSDPYPNGDPNGLLAENLLPLLKSKINICNYVFMRLTKYTDVMMLEFEKILGGDAKEWLKQIPLESVMDLMPSTLDSISSSILSTESSTITVIANKCGAAKEFELVAQIPDWSSIREEQVVVSFHKLPIMRDSKAFKAGHVDVELLRKNLVVVKKSRVIKIAPKPFAKGGMRLAYYGMDVTPFSDKDSVTNELSVLKEFLYLGKRNNSKERYIDQIEIQAISMHLAIQFNKVKPEGLKDVKFLKESVIAFYEREKPCYFTKEKFISDNYSKFNNNWGYVNEKEFYATLQAFSHWTYDVTKGFLQVVDLQGIKDGETFVLTDPVIHCEDVTRFGKTNFGSVGMDRFFMTHSCNAVCHDMALKKHNKQVISR